MPWSQQEGAGEPKMKVSAPQEGGQADTTRGKDIADYNPDIDYKPEGSDPDMKAFDEEEENSDAEYAKMELPQEYIMSEDSKLQSCGKDQAGT